MNRASADDEAGAVGSAETGRSGLGAHFWRLWWANGINSVGDGAFVAAMPLLAVTVTKDPQQIALISAAGYLPWLLVSLPAGAIVDRYDRATLMWRWQAAQAVVVAAIALAAGGGKVSIPLLAGATFLLGSAEVLITNAAQAILPQVVPAALLQRANGNQYVIQTVGASSVGPPLGSLLFAFAVVLPFLVDAGSFAVSAVLLAGLPRRHTHLTQRRSIRAEMAEGLRWLAEHRLLRTLAVLLSANTFCNQLAFSTLVLYATQTLHLSVRSYGLMLVGEGIGSVLGGLVNARIVKRAGVLPAFVAALVLNVASYLGMGLAPNGVVLAALLALCGFVVTISSVVTVSLRQQIVPERLLGRVNSVFRMLGWGLMPVGALVGGLVARHYGLRAPFLAASSLRALILIVTVPILFAELRRTSRAA